MFKQMLEYKLRWAGGSLILVDPAYTSQTCSVCGYVDAENRKTQKRFHCLHCGREENADVNAAKNILAKGLGISSLAESQSTLSSRVTTGGRR